MFGEKLIFVLGIHSRSGTNYVRDVLCEHPAIEASGIPEDYILHNSGFLLSAAAGMEAGHRKIDTDEVLSEIGNGLEGYLRKRTGVTSFVVCKTPKATGSENIEKLFPRARIIYVVRDPRDVAVSAKASFGYNHEHVAERWDENANIIRRMQASQFPTTVVHYERLLRSQPDEAAKLFTFLKLPPVIVSKELPVRGSCELKMRGEELDWKQRNMGEGFNPVGRWRSIWNDRIEAEFTSGIRENMRHFGYVD